MIKAEFIHKLMKVADFLCEEASDISQGAPRHDMQEFLVQCGYDIRRAVADLVTGHNSAGEKDTAALLRARVPLRRCVRCGERVRVEGDTVLCDGVVSKLAPLSTHSPVTYNGTRQPLPLETPTLLGYPVRFVDPEVKEIVETASGEVLWTAPYYFSHLHKSGETFTHDRVNYTVLSHSMENGVSKLTVEVSRPVIIDEVKEHTWEKVEMLMCEQKEKLGS